MENKETRIAITPELHKLLLNKLEELRAQNIKGVTLKKLVEQLCYAGLEYQNQGSNNQQADSLGIHRPVSHPPREYIIETKSELKLMQEALIKKEKRLMEKENYLELKSGSIDEKFLKALSTKEDAIRLMDEEQGKNEKNENHKNTVKHHERTINDLKEEIDDLKKGRRNTDKEIDRALKQILENTKKDVLTDTILPWATPAVVAYFLNQQKDGKKPDKGLSPEIKQFLEMYSKIGKNDQQNFYKEMKDLLNRYNAQKDGEKAPV
jgi:hypothetical protein